MVFSRTRGIVRDYDDARGHLGSMVKDRTSGSLYSWLCCGCDRMEPADLAEWLARCGPRYSMLNQIDVCRRCGAPSFLMWSRGSGTPFLPMKVEWLWMSREISTDPEAWWEIRWMEP